MYKSDFIAISCPRNMRYSSRVSGCPATCIDLNPHPTTCMFPPTEGCECLPGFVNSGDNCVPIAECGCQTQMGYIPVSTDITLKNPYSQTCYNGHLKLAVACCRRPV